MLFRSDVFKSNWGELGIHPSVRYRVVYTREVYVNAGQLKLKVGVCIKVKNVFMHKCIYKESLIVSKWLLFLVITLYEKASSPHHS